MCSRFLLPLVVLVVLALVFAACKDDKKSSDAGNGQPAAMDDTGGDDSGDQGDQEPADDSGDDGGGFGSGTGTLTIGEESWEITGIGCVFSAAEAQNPDFPFNLSGFGESSTGARAQLSADIYDPSGQERTEGEGVSHNISFDDVEDFENPSVSWMTIDGPIAGGAETVLTIDGKSIHGEGVFDDNTTDDFETVAGTLDVSCP